MPLSIGTRLGPYEILSVLGAGGMGEVYRARDTRLGRDVAVKALPDLFLDDPERVARFEREAQLLATLNHPHIGQIYGVEEANDRRFLILELVDGRSLAETISAADSKRLPLVDAVPIARQILDALEAAHEKGIVHRDLKPANIMITADGAVKVLDFGLAKAVGPEGAAVTADAMNSPTLTARATAVGVLLGTAAYMSPEQAKGHVADKRSDVWAFGCVFYEMLTGRRAFAGDDLSDTLAAVLRGEPDWAALPVDVPAGVRTLLQRCLTRDRKARIPEIAAVRYLLEDAVAPAIVAQVTATPQSRRTAWAGMAAGAAVLIAIGAITAWVIKPVPVEPHVVTQFQYPLPDGQNFTRPNFHVLAISPDGAKFAYVANNQLYLRTMDQLEAQPIRGTNESPMEPVFSPDGKWLAYFVFAGKVSASSATIKKIAIDGGTPVTLGQAATLPAGASWHGSTIIFGGNAGPIHGIYSVPDTGGTPQVIARVDAAKEVAHPQMLDDGKHLLFDVRTAADEHIVLQPLDGRARRVLVTGGRHARVLPTGHLVYGQDSALLAVPFDLKRLTVSGGSAPIVENIRASRNDRTSQFAIAPTGVLAFVPGASDSQRTLVWVDRQGREQPIEVKPRAYQYPSLSPEGTWIVVNASDEEKDLWLIDLEKKTETRLTFGPATEGRPAWLPDGRHVVFTLGEFANRLADIYRKAADGTGAAEAITQGRTGGEVSSVSTDGKFLIFNPEHRELRIVRLDLGGPHRPLLANPNYLVQLGAISPDGRWLAYNADESGFQLYVRPFPDLEGGRWQVHERAVFPVWTRSGRELVFRTLANRLMMSVSIQPGAQFEFGKPTVLFDASPYLPGVRYDISPDGRRFLMVKPVGTDTARPSIIVVSHWFDELRARMAR